MRQIEIFEIQSPCIGVCQSGPKGNCLGCYRTREERLYWMQLEDDVKRKIIKACAMRKKRAQAKSKTSEEQTQPPQQQSFWD